MIVKVKNKYLISGLLLFIFLIIVLNLVAGDYFLYRANSARRRGDHAEAFAYYAALITKYPRHPKLADALYWSADLLPGSDYFQATLFPSHSSVSRQIGGTPLDTDVSLTREDFYLRIKEDHPEHWAFKFVPLRLAEIYRQQGDSRAEELYLEALYNFDQIEAGLGLVALYLAESRPEEALKIIHYCQANLPHQDELKVQLRLGDVYGALGEVALAEAAYQEVIERSKNEKYVSLQAEEAEDKLAALAKGSSGAQLEIAGLVTLQGVPLGGIDVHVQRIREDGSVSWRSDTPGLWVTNQQGRFAGSLVAGEYEIGISLNYNQAKQVEGYHLQIINGKLQPGLPGPHFVEFRFVDPVQILELPETFRDEPFFVKWEAYPGAGAYQVFVSASLTQDEKYYSSVMHDAGTTKETMLLLKDFHLNPFGVYGTDGQGVYPLEFLNDVKLYDSLHVTVQALSADGVVLASSSGLDFDSSIDKGIPIFAGEKTELEHLFLAREYDKAVELAERQVAEQPDDVKGLWTLARIYFYGTYSKTNSWEREDFAHRDLEKSLLMLNRIQEIAPGPDVERALEIVARILAG